MIYLTEKIAVTADQHQYIVGKPRLDARKGKMMDRPRYYTTLPSAVKGAVLQAMRDKVADDEITTLREFLVEYQRITDEFAKQLAPLA